MTKGIRGAITVKKNTAEAIREATLELLNDMVRLNNIKTEDISHAIFTLTKDLNAVFPAKFARVEYGWDKVAMMCYHELDVPESLEKCLRVMIVVNCEAEFEPKFVYLRGAKTLRDK